MDMTDLASMIQGHVGSHSVAATAFGCMIAFFTVRHMLIHVIPWMQVHLCPVLWQGKDLPPGSLGFLLMTETLQFISSLRQGGLSRFVSDRTERFRSQTFKTSLFLCSTVIVQGAAANRFVAIAESKRDLLNAWPASTLELLGKNVPAAVHAAQHKRQRQIMSACLRPAGLQKVMSRADRMTRQHFNASWKDGAQLSIASTLKTHVLRIACSLLAGMEEKTPLTRMEVHFNTWISGLLAVPLDVPGTTFHKAKRARAVLRRQMEELIQHRRQQIRQQGPDGPYEDLLSQMILARDQDGSALSCEELRDVTLFLLFAGHDTVVTVLMFALKFLEQNPSCLDRLVQEHESIASQKQSSETLDWVDVINMKYTWALLQETIRLRSPSTGGMKEAQRELNYNGYVIPKGWKLCFPTFATHENEEYFKDAKKFDPSRFELEGLQKDGPPPYAFVPFGIGPHACKGAEYARMIMSLYIHHLIMKKIRWTSLDLHEKYHAFPIITFTKGYPVVVSCDENCKQD